MSDTATRGTTPSWGDRVWFALHVVASHVEAGWRRLDHAIMPRPRVHRGHERRTNPRACPLCGGPMQRDRRPPRDVRGPNGQIRRLPEEVLDWFRCGRCHSSQIGVKP